MLRVLIKGCFLSWRSHSLHRRQLSFPKWHKLTEKENKERDPPMDLPCLSATYKLPSGLTPWGWVLEQSWQGCTVRSRRLFHEKSQNLTLKKWLLVLKSLIQWWTDSESSNHSTPPAPQGAPGALSRNVKDKCLSDFYYRKKQKIHATLFPKVSIPGQHTGSLATKSQSSIGHEESVGASRTLSNQTPVPFKVQCGSLKVSSLDSHAPNLSFFPVCHLKCTFKEMDYGF